MHLARTTNRRPDLLTTEQAARRLGIEARTLVVWRHEGRDGPAFIRIGRLVRYAPEDLDAFIEANRTRPPRTA